MPRTIVAIAAVVAILAIAAWWLSSSSEGPRVGSAPAPVPMRPDAPASPSGEIGGRPASGTDTHLSK